MLLQFLECTKKAEGGVNESPVLVNPEGICSVNETKIELEKHQIVDYQKNQKVVSFIQLTTGRGVYVVESIEEIKAAVNGAGKQPVPGPHQNTTHGFVEG